MDTSVLDPFWDPPEQVCTGMDLVCTGTSGGTSPPHPYSVLVVFCNVLVVSYYLSSR